MTDTLTAPASESTPSLGADLAGFLHAEAEILTSARGGERAATEAAMSRAAGVMGVVATALPHLAGAASRSPEGWRRVVPHTELAAAERDAAEWRERYHVLRSALVGHLAGTDGSVSDDELTDALDSALIERDQARAELLTRRAELAETRARLAEALGLGTPEPGKLLERACEAIATREEYAEALEEYRAGLRQMLAVPADAERLWSDAHLRISVANIVRAAFTLAARFERDGGGLQEAQAVADAVRQRAVVAR